MSNHFHLQIETSDIKLSTIMERMLKIYSNNFNYRHHYQGHVFQGRYKAFLIEDIGYFLDTSRYIHLNPLKAGMVNLPEEYQYSSYPSYFYQANNPILFQDKTLSFFQDLKSYQDFVTATVNKDNNKFYDLYYEGANRMAQKDLTSKMLESEPDVFADIFNTLLFDSEDTKITDAENTLIDEPTEGLYRNYDGNLRNMFQDIAKGYRNGNSESFLACFNIENESMIKRTVPLKCLGYKFATLKRQRDMYENKRKALVDLKNKAKGEGNADKLKMFEDELSRLGEFHTVPFVSIVLNFDDKEWDEPTNLADLNIDSVYNQFDQPFHIKVFNVKFFTPEQRKMFKSDFRIFLEMFCTNALPKELEGVSLRHPTELVDMIIAFTNNDKLKDIRNKVAINELEGKVINMGNIFDTIAVKEVIDSAKFYHDEGISDSIIIKGISQRLGIKPDEAKEIFEKEVLMLETV